MRRAPGLAGWALDQYGEVTVLRVGHGVHPKPLREIDGHQFLKGQAAGWVTLLVVGVLVWWLVRT